MLKIKHRNNIIARALMPDANYKFYLLQIFVFNGVIALSYILYFTAAIGVSTQNGELLANIQYVIRLYVSIFLIVRFNPLRRIKFNDLDAEVAFTAGIYLLTTEAIVGIIRKYTHELHHYADVVAAWFTKK